MALTKKQFIGWAESKGWEQDKYEHLQKRVGEKEYRFKIGGISVRYEVKSCAIAGPDLALSGLDFGADTSKT